jgi:hypothetical protein
VKPGQYRLLGAKDGFERLSYGAKSVFEVGKVLIVDKNHDLTALELRMTPLGAISGRVIDRLGDPVAKAEVIVGFASSYGGPATFDATQIETDDLGRFRIHSLPSATFYLQTLPPIHRSSEGGPGSLLLPTYFRSASDFHGAEAVQVQAGREIEGIEIVLREGPTVEVDGKISTTGSDVQLSDIDLVLLPSDGNVFRTREYSSLLSKRIGGLNGVSPDGTFHLFGVEPGTYELIATSTGHRVHPALGRIEITVGRENVTGVLLPLAKPLTISWTARLEKGPWEKNSCWFMLNPVGADVGLRSYQVATGPSGMATTSGVLPGRYVVTSDCRNSLYVKSARFIDGGGAQDVLDNGLDLTNATGGSAVEVELGANAAELTGRIQDGDYPSPGRYVTLIPDPALPGQTLRFRSGMTDEEGRFRLTHLAPGDYRLYAWVEPLSSLVLVNELFLARFQAQSKKVSVTGGRQDVGVWSAIKP